MPPNPVLRAGNKDRPGGIGREALSAAALYFDIAPEEPRTGCAVTERQAPAAPLREQLRALILYPHSDQRG